ncbi:ABC transporter substrate-binding protein [Microbacterium sp.]|uniref:ABC transporter substrate-binding protein n=1 Tax=Microbacterium sp. TaxID=51671 RepID=UPI003F95A2A4
MRTHRRRLSGAVAVAAAFALALTGCASGGGGEDAERVYVRAIGDDPMGLNGQLVSGATPTMFSGQIMDTLVRMSDQYELNAGLATEWELSEDGLELDLTLREGVSWHDGEPFTAEDVKFNLEEIIALQSFGAPLAERIDSTEVTGEHSVTVHLTEPYGPLLETLAVQFMIPKHVYEDTDYVTNEANMAPIGTGPLMFDSYDSGEQIVLVKNPDYWEGEVQVDRVVYPIMADPNSRATALFEGEVDQAEIAVSQQERVSGEDDLALMETGAFTQLVSMMFNAKSEYLSDPDVRRAVFAAMDRDEIVDTALSGIGEPANGFFPDALEWAQDEDIDFDRDFPRDVDAINRTLDEAGFPRDADGTRFTLTVQYIAELTDAAATAEMAQSMLGEVGIELELVASAGAVFTENVYTKGDFDIAFLRSTVGADPSIGITRWYACNEEKAAAANPSGICDDVIDEAAAGAVTAPDRETRAEHFRDLQQRANELMIYAPLAWFNGAFPTVNQSEWQGQLEPQQTTNRMPWLTMSQAD